eukprot:CAMPEP_0174246162 /NCGR_PEP_ID=MMETSP0417-20130205/41933_1 /TAXON_ID=242541 /ORGANISM="Mayorella sp, Strain BSH-02190019" /LENGTH=489 /DNA_ID=CAMNT_0015326013 /DNA_START=109 /DNA_END=1578 /DNA_ORIENTATION=-
MASSSSSSPSVLGKRPRTGLASSSTLDGDEGMLDPLPSEESATAVTFQDVDHYDIGLITVMKSEFEGVRLALKEEGILDQLKPEASTSAQTHLYFPMETPLHSYRLVLCLTDDQGASELPSAVAHLVERYGVSTVVLLGVSGSLKSKDVQLGQVVVAESVNYFAHRSAMVDAPDDERFIEFLAGGKYYQATDHLVREARRFEYRHPELYKEWQAKAGRLGQELEAASVQPAAPCIHTGPIATGASVVKGSAAKATLQRVGRTLLAVDMESHSLLDEAQRRTRENGEGIDCLILRAISDDANQEKDALSKLVISKDSFFADSSSPKLLQVGAAYNAAQLFVEFAKARLFNYFDGWMVDQYRALKEEKERASRAMAAFTLHATAKMRELAEKTGLKHIYVESKNKEHRLEYLLTTNSPHPTPGDYEKAIGVVLAGTPFKKRREQIRELARDRAAAREKPKEMLELFEASAGQRRHSKPIKVDEQEVMADSK